MVEFQCKFPEKKVQVNLVIFVCVVMFLFLFIYLYYVYGRENKLLLVANKKKQIRTVREKEEQAMILSNGRILKMLN